MSKRDSVELLALLETEGHLRGVRRPKARLKGISLAGADLSRSHLCHADFTQADLSGVDFSGADLSGAVFRGADLSRAVLTGAIFRKAKLRDANLAGVEATRADFSRAQLTGARLDDGVFEDAGFVDADLERITAARATFRGARLGRVTLAGATLAGADLTGADLEEAFLEHSKLIDVRLDDARLERANLVGVELRAPQGLSGTDLRDVDLADAHLRDTSFAGADLRGAILDQVLCEHVTFQGAKLDRADFQGVRGLDDAEIAALRDAGAIVDALFFERVFKFFRSSRAAQAAAAIVMVSAVVFVYFYYTDPDLRPVDVVMDDARALRKDGKYQEAIALYDHLLDRVAGHARQTADVLDEKAETLSEMGRPAEAAKLYGKLVVLEEDEDRDESINAQLKQAQALVDAGKGERAVALIQAIAGDETNAPKDVARALLALSRTYQKLGYQDRAVEIFKETMERFPHDPDVAFDVNLQMGEVYLERRDYDQAAALLQNLEPLARNDNQRVAVLILKARMFDAMGDRERSLETFESLIKRYPKSADVSPEVKMDLAQLMLDKGEYDWAGRIYKDIIAHARDPLLKSQAQLAYGMLLKRVGKTEEAIRLFRRVRHEATNNEELQGSSRLEEAETLAAMQRYDEAFKLLDEVVASAEPGLAAGALLRRGQLLAQSGRLDAASKVYRQVIDTFKSQTEVVVTAQMELARLESSRGNPDKAVPIYESLLRDPRARPFQTHLLNELGHVFADLRRHDDAERTFRRLLEFQDDEEAVANARFGLARLALARSDTGRAASLYKQVANTVSDINLKATALESLARLYADGGDISRAIDAYQQMLNLVPPRHDAAFAARQGMAELFQRQGEPARAEALYKASLESATRADVRARTLLALGRLHLDQQQPTEAIQVFQAVREKYEGVPDADYDARIGLAEAYRMQGKLDLAITTLRAAASTAADPRQATQALEQLAQLYEQTGQPEQAMAVGRQILDMAGEDPEVRVAGRLALASGLRDQGDTEGALEIYRELEADIQDRNLRLTILDAEAHAYQEMGRLEDAARAYQEIIDHYRDNIDIYHNAMMGLASVRTAQGNLDDAAALYETVARDTMDQGMRVWALESLAQVYTRAGKPDAAARALKRAGKAQPVVTSGTRLEQANAARARGDFQEALARYDQIVQESADPGQRAWALVFAGQILAEEDRQEEALRRFQQVIEQFPEQKEQVLNARIGAAGVFRARHQLLEAAARYEDVAQGDAFPDYRVSAALSAAAIYREQGLLDKARAVYEDVLKRFPDRQEAAENARLQLADLALATGNTDQALVAFRSLSTEARDRAVRGKALAGLVRCYATLGDQEKAAEAFGRLKQVSPSEGDALIASYPFLNGS